jgi:precorrin-2/cobalt-factor-2 C20-methyltransferase
MNRGILYGVGIGPGDPKLLTLRALSLLKGERIIIMPKPRGRDESLALRIVMEHIPPDKEIIYIEFPMSRDKEVLKAHWTGLAEEILDYLAHGENVVYVTLGDPFVYSTYIYLIRALREISKDVEVQTVPGISSYSLAASIANVPLCEHDEKLVLYPASSDLEGLRDALDSFRSVVIMKIGKRLGRVIDILQEKNLLQHSVFIQKAGLPGQRIEFDLSKISRSEEGAGNLSIILVKRQV